MPCAARLEGPFWPRPPACPPCPPVTSPYPVLYREQTPALGAASGTTSLEEKSFRKIPEGDSTRSAPGREGALRGIVAASSRTLIRFTSQGIYPSRRREVPKPSALPPAATPGARRRLGPRSPVPPLLLSPSPSLSRRPGPLFSLLSLCLDSPSCSVPPPNPQKLQRNSFHFNSEVTRLSILQH